MIALQIFTACSGERETAPMANAGATVGSAGVVSGAGGTGDSNVVGGGGGNGAGGASATPGIAGGGSGGAPDQSAGAAGAAVGGTAGMAGAPGEPASELPSCDLSFPYLPHGDAGYWLGADSNFSLQLSATTSLMTFQDSIVAGPSGDSRSGSTFVANTVATIGCTEGEYDIQYYWRHDASGESPIFDDPNAGGDRLWTQAPWLHEGRLFLTATRVGEGGELGFEEHGMTLARVTNPTDPPDQWNAEYFTLTEQRATVGKGVVVYDDHVYLFTPFSFDAVLARLALSKLTQAIIAEADLEYLASDGSWQPGLDLQNAERLPLAANTGLTVRYHEPSARFVALYVTTNGWPSSTIAVSSAEQLEGPWSTPQVIYEIPEMMPESPEYDVDNVCYGGAEHVIHNGDPDNRLLFTYTCNSMSLEKQQANLDLYVPIVVDLPHPLAP